MVSGYSQESVLSTRTWFLPNAPANRQHLSTPYTTIKKHTRYGAISRNHLRKNSFHHPSVQRLGYDIIQGKAKSYTKMPHSQASPLSSSSAHSIASFLFQVLLNLVCGPAVDLSKKIPSDDHGLRTCRKHFFIFSCVIQRHSCKEWGFIFIQQVSGRRLDGGQQV